MKSDKPFKKAFICGAVLYAGKSIILVAVVGFQNLAYWLGVTLPSCFFAAIITGIWAHFSKKSWSWLRFSLTVFILHFVLATMAVSGERLRQAREKSQPAATEIERKTFSVSLPKGWSEDKTSPKADGNSLAHFANSESCAVSVVVRPKSAEVSAATLLEAVRGDLEKKLSDAKVTEFGTWGQYQGKGFEIEGTLQNSKCRARAFGFENSDNACVIMEMASLNDYKTYADDFEMIRRAFKLK